MNNILKLTKQNGILCRLIGIITTTTNFFFKVIHFFTGSNKFISYSKKSSNNNECPFNNPNEDITQKIGTGLYIEDSNKSCPVFYTGPPSKKSICEQRRIKKCLKYQEEHGCKVDEKYCKGLEPDCHVLPNKEIPGRGQVKTIPGAPVKINKTSSSSHPEK